MRRISAQSDLGFAVWRIALVLGLVIACSVVSADSVDSAESRVTGDSLEAKKQWGTAFRHTMRAAAKDRRFNETRMRMRVIAHLVAVYCDKHGWLPERLEDLEELTDDGEVRYQGRDAWGGGFYFIPDRAIGDYVFISFGADGEPDEGPVEVGAISGIEDMDLVFMANGWAQGGEWHFGDPGFGPASPYAPAVRKEPPWKRLPEPQKQESKKTEGSKKGKERPSAAKPAP